MASGTRAYGLCLESDCSLPGLAFCRPGEEVPDLFIHVGESEYFPPDPTETVYTSANGGIKVIGEPGLSIYRSTADGAFTFRYAEGVEFRIDADRRHLAARFAPHWGLWLI